MSKTLLSVRLEEEELVALRRAAAEDSRPVAAMARLLIHAGLKLRGHLDGNGGEERPERVAADSPAVRRTRKPAGRAKG